MMKTNEVGPFTPQEIDEVAQKLKAQGAAFEIMKDEESEKAQMKNDFGNVVKKAEYRLETYLGQVFYVRVTHEDFDKNKNYFAKFGMATTHVENPSELDGDTTGVAIEAKEKKKLQALLAGSIVFLLVSLFVYGLFQDLF